MHAALHRLSCSVAYMNSLSRNLYNKQLLYPWVPFLSCRVGTADVLQN